MSEACDIVEFGAFRLDTARRHLTRDGQPVALSSRAFDILALLVDHRDRVMTKDEIITHVWRGIVVEENNLAVQVSSLRRALGEADLESPLILTVPGQGYRFVGRVTPAPPAAVAQFVAAPPTAADINMPAAAPAEAQAARPWFIWPSLALLAAVACAALYLLVRPAAPPMAPAPPAPPRLSIAVLPFRDLSDDRCCAYLADAVSDDLTTDLSHIPGSVVIARESSDMYRDKKLPTADIGHALNVRYLLEGSLRAVEGNLSINAQLIEAATGGHLWAEHFSVPRNHLGAAQDAIVHRLASALGVTLIQIEGTAAARERGNDPDALDLFFQARSILDRSDTLEAMTDAQHLLERALEKQGDFPDGLAELAILLARKVNDSTDPQFTEDLAEARSVSARAARVAPASGLVIAARGLLLLIDHQWNVAQDSLESALNSEPESVPVRNALVTLMSRLGEYEAERRGIEELLQIDPEGPNTKALYIRLGVADYMLDRPQDALRWLTLGTAGRPDPAPGAGKLDLIEYASLYRIAALVGLGATEEAKREQDRHNRIWPHRSAWMVGASFTKAQASLPTFRKFIDALVVSGMPRAIDEHSRTGVPPVDQIGRHEVAFDPTPDSIPAPAEIVDTSSVRALMLGNPPPFIVNVGSGSVTLDHTVAGCTGIDPATEADVEGCAALFRNGASGAAVIVMGRGVTDWNGYNGALALATAGLKRVLWYRGGEESWAASGGPSKDMRP